MERMGLKVYKIYFRVYSWKTRVITSLAIFKLLTPTFSLSPSFLLFCSTNFQFFCMFFGCKRRQHSQYWSVCWFFESIFCYQYLVFDCTDQLITVGTHWFYLCPIYLFFKLASNLISLNDYLRLALNVGRRT